MCLDFNKSSISLVRLIRWVAGCRGIQACMDQPAFRVLLFNLTLSGREAAMVFYFVLRVLYNCDHCVVSVRVSRSTVFKCRQPTDSGHGGF